MCGRIDCQGPPHIARYRQEVHMPSVTATGNEVVYQIDHDNRLIGFNSEWDAFAVTNDSPHLVHGNIIGQLLWDFIQDPETHHLHQTLLQRVRQQQRPIILPFRCDSATLRRFMQMEILPLPKGTVEYRCLTQRTETREAVSLLEPNAKRSDQGQLLRMCSWCKKIAVNDDWMEVEDAIRQLQLFASATLPGISHTMCDACLHKLSMEPD